MIEFNHRRMLLLAAAALLLFSAHTVYCDVGGDAELQWQILTKLNYSSQIRLSPRSGELKSLMKGLSHAVSSDEMGIGDLKLMVLYKNEERMLADALGAADGITVFYYHNSLSYRYRGRLRVQNILDSVHYVMSLSPDEQNLKSLSSAEELREFLHSTDKAVLLFEFCGWTPKLVVMNSSIAGSNPGFVGANFSMKNNDSIVGEEKDNRKVEDDVVSCDSDNGLGGPWLNQFTTINNSLVKDVENMTVNAGESCSLFELQQYEIFFHKFVGVAREHFLPPEKYRYAVVRERSLLPLLNVDDPTPGLISVHFAGCPSCTQVLKEVDDLRTVLQSQHSPVSELGDDPHGVEAALPAERPSMLLFIDRSSNSKELRRENQEALDAFRELAKHTQIPNQIPGQAIMRHDRTLATSQASWSTHRHPRLQRFTSDKNIFKDKMSIMIVNEGKQVTLENLDPNLQGMSVQEILSYALKKNAELKLSSLAKDVGFQLLSKDFNIKIESQPPHVEDQANLVSEEIPAEVGKEGAESNLVSEETPNEYGDGGADMDKDQIPADSNRWRDLIPNPSVVDNTMLEGKRDDRSSLSVVENKHGDSVFITSDCDQGWHIGETTHSKMEENEELTNFSGSFFFCDGQFRLLETLTGGLKVPSVVIVDPTSEKHYVLNEQSPLSYFSLSIFIKDFLAGKLHPYIQSSSIVTSPRSAQRPPFVNQGFHETDSIPLVTTHTFSELVLGNESDTRNTVSPWDRNVLVLFSNSWCGFCQRMEFVVREVYRAVKSYAYMVTISSRKEKLAQKEEHVLDVVLKLPLIYMMDCTRNDCGFILRSIHQRDVYPLLLLFPAERKNETVLYEGDIVVSDIIKFLAAHGSNVVDLLMNQGFLQDQNSDKEDVQTRSLHHEVLLKDLSQNLAVKYKINAQLPTTLQEKPQLSAGCVLSATEKLLDVHPFDESKILIVKADESTGFQGLIINKHISWDSLVDLGEENFEFLKEAPLSFGGPVMMRGMPLAALTQKFMEGHQSLEILPYVYFIDQLATPSLLEDIKAGNQSAHDFWFFLGYSSWGWEQMFHEITQGAWSVSNGDFEQLEWPSR